MLHSGSTGNIKAACYESEMMLPKKKKDLDAQSLEMLDVKAFNPTLVLSLLLTISIGGKRAIGSMETIFEDLQTIKPKRISLPPSFWV
jgi:hypothetical protein